MKGSFSVTGVWVDSINRAMRPATIQVTDGCIASIKPLDIPVAGLPYILPGFIDSHVHIESSLLTPAEFARLAVVHGTVATVSDPHEIANVCGLEGVEFMLENGKTVPFKFNFGAPSCVPATGFETAGAVLDAADVERLLLRNDILYLSEMMNFPGVLNGDPEVMQKISTALRLGKPIDGHAPGLSGETAAAYARPHWSRESGAGSQEPVISTDHECFTAEEALDKLRLGMKVIIREGSAAKNFEALIGLLHEWPDQLMFCSDDKHPDSLVLGHINQLCARAVAKGIDVFNILQAACVNPVKHYKLDVGLLQPGDPADFIVVEDLVNFNIRSTFINGELVAENGQSLIGRQSVSVVNNFTCVPKTTEDFAVPYNGEAVVPVIEALDGQLITNKLSMPPLVSHNRIVSDPEKDMLKIAVINRYTEAPVATAFIKGFGLKQGALASSVAHDSHNIVAVGADDESLCKAVNAVIAAAGGLSAVAGTDERVLPLPVAGLMSNGDGYAIAEAYAAIDRFTKEMNGSTLASPFMTLSFMALLVIPHLKLSDKGLFDGDSFSFI